MKIIGYILLLIFGLSTFAVDAQIKGPRLSPLEKIETTIGMAEVELIYSRPSMRNRKIFGELVPFDQIWRTGANLNTKISFSENVQVGDQSLAAGNYAIFSKPNETTWEIYFHSELNEYGAPDTLLNENIRATIMANPITLLNKVETFGITFNNFTSSSAVMSLNWENTRIDIPISVDINELLQTKLYQVQVDFASDYEMAAWIYYDNVKDYSKALNAINRCIDVMEAEIPLEKWMADKENLSNPNRPRRYILKAEALAKLGRKEEAIIASKKSLEIAYKIESDYYIKKNLEYIEEWKK